jgi:hypothetical protein
MQVNNSSNTYYQSSHQKQGYQNKTYGDFSKTESEKTSLQRSDADKIKAQQKTNDHQKENYSGQFTTEMKDVLRSYYSFKSGGNGNFEELKANLQNLAKKLVSYRVDKHQQTWESKLHSFRMDISRESYEKYNAKQDTHSESVVYNQTGPEINKTSQNNSSTESTNESTTGTDSENDNTTSGSSGTNETGGSTEGNTTGGTTGGTESGGSSGTNTTEGSNDESGSSDTSNSGNGNGGGVLEDLIGV